LSYQLISQRKITSSTLASALGICALLLSWPAMGAASSQRGARKPNPALGGRQASQDGESGGGVAGGSSRVRTEAVSGVSRGQGAGVLRGSLGLDTVAYLQPLGSEQRTVFPMLSAELAAGATGRILEAHGQAEAMLQVGPVSFHQFEAPSLYLGTSSRHPGPGRRPPSRTSR
jgi:hypothetical protein